MLKKELYIYAGHLVFRGGKFVVVASALLDVDKNIVNIRELQQKYNNDQQNYNTAEQDLSIQPNKTEMF